MGRGRLFIGVFVALCLALPPLAAEDAAAADTSVECGFTSEVKTDGFDGSTAVASYVVRATWCVETTYETRTFTEDTSGDEVSGSADEAKVDKAKKKKAKGKKAKRRSRRRGKRSKGGGSSTTRTRTERRAVSTCITNFELDAHPTALVDGARLIGATTTPGTTGDSCMSRSYRVAGRFGRDYVTGVPGFNRSVIRQNIDDVTIENYPLGRFGTFDIEVHFSRDAARCDRCLPSFEFCDVRIVGDTSSTCVRL